MPKTCPGGLNVFTLGGLVIGGLMTTLVSYIAYLKYTGHRAAESITPLHLASAVWVGCDFAMDIVSLGKLPQTGDSTLFSVGVATLVVSLSLIHI